MPQLQDGDDVKSLQKKLISLGLYKGREDGIYGPKTAAAVRAYQKAKGLTVDGDAGKQTLGALAIPQNTITTPNKTTIVKPVQPQKAIQKLNTFEKTSGNSFSKKENIITYQGKRYTPYQFQQMVDSIEKSPMQNTFGADINMLKLLNLGRAANNKSLYKGKQGTGFKDFNEAYGEVNKYSLGGTVEEQMNILELMGLKKKVDTKSEYMAGGRVNNYVTDPSDALVKLQTNKAQAMLEGETDFLSNAFGVLAQVAPAVMGAVGGENGEGWGLLNESITGKPYINNIKPGATIERMALGGEVSPNAEVEGEEVGITPDGQFLDFKGPNHEQGGIPVNLPEGTEMFSKRIKLEKQKNGKKIKKSIADWMKEEKEYDKKIAKKYDSDETDQLMKNTHKRASETTQGNIEKYKNVQKAFQQAQEELNEPIGLPEEMEGEQPQFALGGPIKPNTTLLNSEYEFDPLQIEKLKSELNQNLSNINTFPKETNIEEVVLSNKIKPFISKESNVILPNIDSTVKPIDIPNVNPILDVLSSSEKENINTSKSSVLDILKNTGDGLDFTLGDGLAIGGALKSALDLKKNVLANRAGDKPNINPYLNYGQDALRTVEEMFNMQEIQKDDALHDSELSRNAAMNRNNNSARSINTLNALNLASDQQYNDANGKIYVNNAAALQKMMGVKADLQRDIDGNVMKGAAEKDMNDRKDRDAFYANMNEVIKNSGQTAETIGSYLNQMKQAKVSMNLVNELGRHGMRMTKNGTVEMIPGWNEKKGEVKTEEKKDGTIEVQKDEKDPYKDLRTDEVIPEDIIVKYKKMGFEPVIGKNGFYIDKYSGIPLDPISTNNIDLTNLNLPFKKGKK